MTMTGGGGTWRGCATSRHESFFGSMDGLVRCMGWMESIYIIGCIVSWPARKERRLFCQMRTLLGWVLGLRHMVAVSYSSALPYVRAECRIHSKLKGSIIGDIIRDFLKRNISRANLSLHANRANFNLDHRINI